MRLIDNKVTFYRLLSGLLYSANIYETHLKEKHLNLQVLQSPKIAILFVTILLCILKDFMTRD